MGAGSSVINNNSINPNTNDDNNNSDTTPTKSEKSFTLGAHIISMSSGNKFLPIPQYIKTITNVNFDHNIVQKAYNIGYKAGRKMRKSKILYKLFNGSEEHYNNGFLDGRSLLNLAIEEGNEECEDGSGNKHYDNATLYQKNYGKKYVAILNRDKVQ